MVSKRKASARNSRKREADRRRAQGPIVEAQTSRDLPGQTRPRRSDAALQQNRPSMAFVVTIFGLTL
jgi:hypothetical protein